MEKHVETGWLLDFYGPLLTERQRELLTLYCEEDWSLGEIAAQEQISRQGVHDAVRRAQQQLLEYEQRLGLLARFRTLWQALNTCEQALGELPEDPAIDRVRRIISGILRDEEGYHGL